MNVRDIALSVDELSVRFPASYTILHRLAGRTRRVVHAVEDVSFEVRRASTFALVGESGCGKSTIARSIAGIQAPSSGAVSFMGVDIASLKTRRGALPYRRNLQMIFQDPHASLNPRWRIGRIVAEPILTHRLIRQGPELRRRVDELLRTVGLAPADAEKFAHQFSGGQRQRISIARALASNPAFIVCDEPTSALDVSVQAQILNLMKRLQRELGLTYLLISHNLAVVAHMADRVGVMYLGRLVEEGDVEEVLYRSRHPYTRLLLKTVPDPHAPNRGFEGLAGEVPSPFAPPPGCTFHPRCPFVQERCIRERPIPLPVGGVKVACHGVEEGRLPANEPQNSIPERENGD